MGRAGALLVGRDEERSALAAALDAAADEPVLVLLRGEAGMGKTRLLDDVSDAARETGWRVLTGHCLPLSGGGLPYGPWTDVLRSLLRSEGRPAFLALLGEELAGLGPVLPLAAATDRDVPAAHVLEALLSVVERLAADRPLVLGLEDLHWADAASIDALAFLVRNLADLPVLLVASSRSDEELDPRTRTVLAELGRTPRARTLALGPLDPDGTDALVAALGGERAESLYARTGGNPYYLTQLVAAGPRPVTHLNDAVLARLEGLPPSAGRVLAGLAVAGQPTSQQLLSRVLDLPVDDVVAALHGLTDRRLVRAADLGHLPAHALAAEAALSRLLPGEIAALHTAYADALGEQPSLLGDPAALAVTLAEHRAAAGDRRRLLAAAAEVVRATGPAASTLRWGRVALESWDSAADPVADAGMTRGELLSRTADASLDAGDPASAVLLAEQSLTEVDAADPAVGGLRAERLAHYLWAAGRSVQAAEVNEDALALLAGVPSLALARAQASHASTLMVLGRWADARARAQQAISTAQAVGAGTEQAHATATLGVVLVSDGQQLDDGLAALAEACALARGAGDVRLLWRNLLNAAYGNELAGRLELAVELSLEALGVARRHGLDASDERAALANAVSPLVELGRWEQAQELLRSAPEGAADDPRVRLLDRVAAQLAVARGEPVRSGVLDGHEDEPRMVQQREQVRADQALWGGDTDAALAAVVRGLAAGGGALDVARLLATGLRAAADALALPAGAGGPDPARRQALLDQVSAWRAELPADGSPEVRALCLQAEAEAARAQGADSADAWLPVVDAWRRLERPYAVALALWRRAEALPDRAALAEPLTAAHATALHLGAAPLQRELELLALRTRTPLHRAVAAQPVSGPMDGLALTRREREVLVLLATGASNRQIARRLSITENTAGVHVSNVLRKLGVANRTEATAVAHRLGLAPVEGGAP